jgi:hypothetical protein
VLHLFWLFLFGCGVVLKSLKILVKSLKKIVVNKLENLCEDLNLKKVMKRCVKKDFKKKKKRRKKTTNLPNLSRGPSFPAAHPCFSAQPVSAAHLLFFSLFPPLAHLSLPRPNLAGPPSPPSHAH